ncbi:TetR/AcrR family transcriptional regulator [Pannonibacter indicus]|uniref:TetR/AcrR family transcriptional regulator n=1 Tax=Pannonibacter indicus TaxID=466044 RepID=UPI003919BF91
MSSTQPSSPRRGRGRPKAVDDRQQRGMIVDVAMPLFLAKGYGKTSMNEIAAAAHVSLSTIYRFFPGKQDLFAAIVASHRETMLALPGDYDGLPLDEALARIFRLGLDSEASQRREALMAMFMVEARQFPELMPVMVEHGPKQSKQLLAAWLERQTRLGFAQATDPVAAAGMIMDIVFGAAALKAPGSPIWPEGSERQDYLRRCFRMLADGLARSPASAQS